MASGPRCVPGPYDSSACNVRPPATHSRTTLFVKDYSPRRLPPSDAVPRYDVLSESELLAATSERCRYLVEETTKGRDIHALELLEDEERDFLVRSLWEQQRAFTVPLKQFQGAVEAMLQEATTRSELNLMDLILRQTMQLRM